MDDAYSDTPGARRGGVKLRLRIVRPCDPWHILAALYYVGGGLVGLSGSLALILVAVGIRAVAGAASRHDPDCDFGAFLIVHGALAVVIGWIGALALFATGRNLARRRQYWPCFLAAYYLCLVLPMLGIPTLVLLTRPGVKKTFAASGKRGPLSLFG